MAIFSYIFIYVISSVILAVSKTSIVVVESRATSLSAFDGDDDDVADICIVSYWFIYYLSIHTKHMKRTKNQPGK